MIGCLRTLVRRQPIIVLYFEFKTALKSNRRKRKEHDLRKRCNHRPQTNGRYLEEETQSTGRFAIAGTQSKTTIALSLSKMIIKLEITLRTTLQNNDPTQKPTHSGSNSKQ